jgi:hypothetical protein
MYEFNQFTRFNKYVKEKYRHLDLFERKIQQDKQPKCGFVACESSSRKKDRFRGKTPLMQCPAAARSEYCVPVRANDPNCTTFSLLCPL